MSGFGCRQRVHEVHGASYQAKLSDHADLLTPKLQQNLEQIFKHNQIAVEHLAMANETISQIRAS
jgi:hypothetical protein